MPVSDGQFFQVGIVVADLDEAMRDLSRSLQLTWGQTVTSTLGDWTFRLAFSREGPPHIELIEAPADSLWELDPDGRPRIDHLQWWSSEIETDTRRLVGDGATVEVDGVADYGGAFRYLRLASGLRVELIDDPDGSRRAHYRERWRID